MSKCTRVICQREGVCRHTQTGEMYCVQCARKINGYAGLNLVEITYQSQAQQAKAAADRRRHLESEFGIH